MKSMTMKQMSKLATLFAVMMIIMLSSCKKEDSTREGKNSPPVSNAGADLLIVLPVDTVTLNGSASFDPDNNIVSVQWKKVSGPSTYTIARDNTMQPILSNLTQGSYGFELRVTDAGGLYDMDTVVVAVYGAVVSSDVDTYVVGYASDNLNGQSFLWKNGVAQKLGNGSDFTNPTSVFVSGPDVYVVGGSYNTGSGSATSTVKLWKNGVIQNLSGVSEDAAPSGLFVSGSDVFVAGVKAHAVTGNTVATLWKNGVPQSLTDGSTFAAAESVFVSGSHVYVAGNETSYNDRNIARLWKDGVLQQLENALEGAANSVFVSNNEVYVAGWSSTGATLWKNGMVQNIFEFQDITSINSIYVSGSDLYSVGSVSDIWTFPILWKNGVVQNLGNGEKVGEAYSVFELGGDVYVAGYGVDPNGNGNGIATLWKNGAPHYLENNFPRSFATSVFVVKK